jgi:hypothetical protein
MGWQNHLLHNAQRAVGLIVDVTSAWIVGLSG